MNLSSISKIYFLYSELFCPMCFIFPFMEISFIFVYFITYCVRGNNHFDVRFRRIEPVLFPLKDGKDAAREGGNGRRNVCFPPESASFPL